MVGKPIDFFAKLPASDDLHLVPIPFSNTFNDYYALGEFTKADYPTLIAQGDTVTTLAVPAVLAVYNGPAKSDRARRVQRLVERMFANWEKFQSPPRHPKWRDVNLAATVPGWTRWDPVEKLLEGMRAQQADSALGREWLSNRLSASGAKLSDTERERLFQEFQQWQRTRR
jgi:hypothetical protein